MNCHMHVHYGIGRCPDCARESAERAAKRLGAVGLEGAYDGVLPTLLRATSKPALPLDSAERKRWPMFTGLLRYFPAALANVSNHSFIGNEKHNPGLPLQHARGKSGDHEDCIVRHLVDAAEHKPGSAARIDELRALAWRSLALLQEECELAGYSPAPAASFTKKD